MGREYGIEVTRIGLSDRIDRPDVEEQARASRRLEQVGAAVESPNTDLASVPISGRNRFRGRTGVVGFREAAGLDGELDVGPVSIRYALAPPNTADPVHFADYPYGLNPSRRHKPLGSGELLYSVEERG
jgi:hypothetical protein